MQLVALNETSASSAGVVDWLYVEATGDEYEMLLGIDFNILKIRYIIIGASLPSPATQVTPLVLVAMCRW